MCIFAAQTRALRFSMYGGCGGGKIIWIMKNISNIALVAGRFFRSAGLVSAAVFMLFAETANADNRTDAELKSLAKATLAAPHAGMRKMGAADIKTPEILMRRQMVSIVGYRDGGFVVMANDDDFAPVLGYSDAVYSDDFAPCGFEWWLDTQEQSMKARKAAGTKSETYKIPTGLRPSVDPMIKTFWGQGNPYNDLCVVTVNGHTYRNVTGCVATSLAQVMNFYQYPRRGTKTVSYVLNYNDDRGKVTFTANLDNSVYDWSNMLIAYGTYYENGTKKTMNYNTNQANAVSLLMRDCGYSVNMNYDVNGSGAYQHLAAYALSNYFSYNIPTYIDRSKFTDENWSKRIYTDLSLGRPLIYSGSSPSGEGGHSFVVDGYNSEGYVHVNWGWDGGYDGYYDMFLMNPPGSNFSLWQSAVVDITAPTSEPINFTDSNVESICISAWDTDGFGRLSYDEAREVYEITDQFTGKTNIKSFDELIHFRSLRTIGANAFRGCTGLESIVLPEGLSSIGENAFYNCKGLKSLTSMVKSPFAINDNTFAASPVADYIYNNVPLLVPVNSAERYASTPGWKKFSNIVEMVHFADKEVERICLENFDTNGDGMLSGDEVRAVTSIEALFKGNKIIRSFDELQYFTGVDRLKISAFLDCTGLQSIVLPPSITSIGNKAFNGCSALVSITLLNSEPYSIRENVFDDTVYENATLFVPEGTSENYMETDYWSRFSNFVELADPTTSITMPRVQSPKPTGVYDLQGRLVSNSSTKNLPHGVYIKDGKKIIR